jgi:hypothetical protein
LKRDFLVRFFERSQAFFLTGGSALGIFYLEHRLSYDLDFFTAESGPVDWHVLANSVRGIAAAIQAEVHTITASPDFHRFELVRGAERELLDFVIERVPQVDSRKERYGNIRVDTLREIMVNKVCALIGRTEIKDLVDLYFLSQRGLRVVDHLADAQKKEGGLDPAMISYLLADVRVERAPDYLLQPVDVAELNRFIRDLQRALAALAFPQS